MIKKATKLVAIDEKAQQLSSGVLNKIFASFFCLFPHILSEWTER